MNRKKVGKSTAKRTKIDTVAIEAVQPIAQQEHQAQKKPSNKVGFILTLILIAFILLIRKGYIVAAMVNGRPIFSWSVTKSLTDRFGAQQLETMIAENLIIQEAQKEGVTVGQEEIDKKADAMIARFGEGVSLDDILSFQGLTRDEFNHQMRLQIMIEKIISRDMSYSDDELDRYIATNSALFTATSSAQNREQAKNVLIENTVSGQVTQWLEQLKELSQIYRFLQ